MAATRPNKNAGGTPRMRHGIHRNRRRGPYSRGLRGPRATYDRPALDRHVA